MQQRPGENPKHPSVLLGDTMGFDAPVPRTSWQLPDAVLSRFRIGAELGSGGMGRVYRARDLELDEEVALKVLHQPAGGLPAQLRDLLRREVKATRRINSPHVVRVFEFGTAGDVPWFTMELVDGESLESLHRRKGPLDSGEIIRLGRAICYGLAAAHAAGVVHRDLKPANVLVGVNRVAICDFGLAHLDWSTDKSRSAVGTPAYFAPEQMTGGKITPATDLFALGVVFYELATGRTPWSGDSVMALAMARLTEPVSDPRTLAPQLPDELALLILQCLEADPQRRPLSAAAVAGQLVGQVGRSARNSPQPSPAFGAPPTPSQPRDPAVQATGTELRSETLAPRGTSSPRLIVLPFASVGPATDLSVGLAEDVTAALMPHKGLRVVAARVARGFAEERRDPAEIGRSLGVDFAVDGSVRKVGDGARIQISLTSCATDAVVWSLQLDCDASRAHQVHDEIAFALARQLVFDPLRVSTTPEVTDPDVLRAYVAGRRLYNQAMISFDPAVLRESIGHFELAAALAPEEPLVIAALAVAVSGQLGLDAVIAEGALHLAQRLASRAVQLAPTSGEAWLACGLAEMHAGQPVAAAFSFRRSISLTPSLPEPRLHLAALLADAGRLTHARQQLDVALELGGDASAILGEQARVAVLAGDVAIRDRLRQQLTARGLPPFSWWRGVYSGALAVNDYDQILKTYREMVEPQWQPLPPFIQALRVVLGSLLRETPLEEHRALLPTVGLGAGATPMRRCRTLLLWLARRKDEEEPAWILDNLRQAVGYGLCNSAWIDRADALERVRDQPGFASLRQTVARRATAIFDAYCGDSGGIKSETLVAERADRAA